MALGSGWEGGRRASERLRMRRPVPAGPVEVNVEASRFLGVARAGPGPKEALRRRWEVGSGGKGLCGGGPTLLDTMRWLCVSVQWESYLGLSGRVRILGRCLRRNVGLEGMGRKLDERATSARRLAISSE